MKRFVQNLTSFNTLEKYKFKKVDLLYFNNVNTFVVFYLINEETNEVYMNDSWISALGLNYKKYVRKINEILNKQQITFTSKNQVSLLYWQAYLFN